MLKSSLLSVLQDRSSPRLMTCRGISPPAQGWTAAGGLWWSAPARWPDRWRRSTAGSFWMPPSSQRRSPQRWGCTGPFSLSSRNGTSCLPLHSWSGGKYVLLKQATDYKWEKTFDLKISWHYSGKEKKRTPIYGFGDIIQLWWNLFEIIINISLKNNILVGYKKTLTIPCGVCGNY